MFCSHCGSRINDNAKFCTNCGAAVIASAPQPENPQPAAPVTENKPPVNIPSYAGNGAVRNGIPAPGFSDRVNHPEILEAVRKNRKASKIFAFITVPLPIIGFLIYSYVSGDIKTGQALIYGALVSFVFLLFYLVNLAKQRKQNSYEATVIDKKMHETYRHINSDNRELVTEYITVVRTSEGKKKKIVEQEGSQILAYYYLEVGDKFKYHPQFNFPYELYDKSHAPYIACVSCRTQNSIEADRCERCNLPLLK